MTKTNMNIMIKTMEAKINIRMITSMIKIKIKMDPQRAICKSKEKVQAVIMDKGEEGKATGEASKEEVEEKVK